MSDGGTMPYQGDHDDLKAARGIMFGLAFVAVIWVVIAAIGYGIYWALSG